MLCDNNHHILAISDCIEGSHNDSFKLVENMEILAESLLEADIDLHGSHLNADAGFDVEAFTGHVGTKYGMIANIPRNRRNDKKAPPQHRYWDEGIYSFRRKIETVFAWLDTYKRILIRFEYKACNSESWLYLASSLINLRTKIN